MPVVPSEASARRDRALMALLSVDALTSCGPSRRTDGNLLSARPWVCTAEGSGYGEGGKYYEVVGSPNSVSKLSYLRGANPRGPHLWRGGAPWAVTSQGRFPPASAPTGSCWATNPGAFLTHQLRSPSCPYFSGHVTPLLVAEDLVGPHWHPHRWKASSALLERGETEISCQICTRRCADAASPVGEKAAGRPITGLG